MLEEVLNMPREMIVVPYDSNWPMMFESEKAMLLDIFGDFVMECIRWAKENGITQLW